jgi:SMODS-associating 2TM, beta-strand rich effector domain
VWGAGLWALGIPLTWDHAKPYTVTVTTVTLLLWLFDSYVWRWKVLRRFIKIPDLQGTWRVELSSTYVNPTTGERSGPLAAYVLVRQRFSQLSLRLMTAESNSHLIAYSFLFPDDRTVELTGVYQSDPSIHVRGRTSEIHYGAFKLRASGDPIDRMEGHYWTDRNTTGSIVYVERRPELCDRLDLAEGLFTKSSQT